LVERIKGRDNEPCALASTLELVDNSRSRAWHCISIASHPLTDGSLAEPRSSGEVTAGWVSVLECTLNLRANSGARAC
jgi:hypothetical protein